MRSKMKLWMVRINRSGELARCSPNFYEEDGERYIDLYDLDGVDSFKRVPESMVTVVMIVCETAAEASRRAKEWREKVPGVRIRRSKREDGRIAVYR